MIILYKINFDCLCLFFFLVLLFDTFGALALLPSPPLPRSFNHLYISQSVSSASFFLFLVANCASVFFLLSLFIHFDILTVVRAFTCLKSKRREASVPELVLIHASSLLCLLVQINIIILFFN